MYKKSRVRARLLFMLEAVAFPGRLDLFGGFLILFGHEAFDEIRRELEDGLCFHVLAELVTGPGEFVHFFVS